MTLWSQHIIQLRTGHSPLMTSYLHCVRWQQSPVYPHCTVHRRRRDSAASSSHAPTSALPTLDECGPSDWEWQRQRETRTLQVCTGERVNYLSIALHCGTYLLWAWCDGEPRLGLQTFADGLFSNGCRPLHVLITAVSAAANQTCQSHTHSLTPASWVASPHSAHYKAINSSVGTASQQVYSPDRSIPEDSATITHSESHALLINGRRSYCIAGIAIQWQYNAIVQYNCTVTLCDTSEWVDS